MRAPTRGGGHPQGVPLRLARQDREMCAQRSPQGGRGNPLRVGIIGCGTIGAVHAQAAAASDQIELVAVADVQRELAEKTAAAHTVETVYSSGAELLADARVEAVVLALPACFRIELGIQALRAGQTSADGKTGGPQCRRSAPADLCPGGPGRGLLLFPFSFSGIDQDCYRLDRPGQAGRAAPAPLPRDFSGGASAGDAAPAWRLSRELNGGGILVNWGCYDLDYLLGISGWRLRPQTVLAQSWRVPATFADTVAPASDAETHITGTGALRRRYCAHL